MKLVLLLSMAFIFAECQFFYDYYSPKLVNPFLNSMRRFHNPYNWFSADGDQQGNIVFVQSGNSEEDPQDIAVRSEGEAEGRTKFGPSLHADNEVMPRFFFNQGGNNAGIYRPQGGFNRRTLLYTTTETRTVLTTTQCIPASVFPLNAGSCARRRRDIEALIKNAIEVNNRDIEAEIDSLFPSPVETVETTAVPTQFSSQGSPGNSVKPDLISSSKGDEPSKMEESASFKREKRFFFMATASTFTQISFTTSTFTQRVNLRILNNQQNCNIAANGCQLACIPKGYTTC